MTEIQEDNEWVNRVRVEDDRLILQVGGKEIVFRTRLYTDDWVYRDEFESDDGDGINVTMYQFELAQRMTGELPDAFYLLDEFDSALVQTAVSGLIDAAFDDAEAGVDHRDGEVWASIRYPLRPQTTSEIELHGRDVKGLEPRNVKFRPVLARDLVRADGAGSPTARIVKLISCVTEIPEHQVMRMDMRDFAALESAYRLVKKNPSEAARMTMRMWIQARARALAAGAN
jgi:hypothetical protein